MSRFSVLSIAVALLVSLVQTGSSLEPAGPQRQSGNATTTAVGTLGGDFSVNASGAATYSIELEVPPGTNGSAPELHIGYDSQSPNGLLGMGFTLSGLSAISRCAASLRLDGYIGGTSFDDRDRFCLDGQRLVKVAGNGGYGAPDSVYHTERETWTKVVARGTCGTGPCWFEAWNKDGRKLAFGADPQSRVPLPNRAEIAGWQITRISDLNGNTVSVVYDFHPQTLQIQPREIRYTSNAAANLNAGRFVRFEYESRTDAVPRYVGGYLFQQDQRLRTIRTFVGQDPVLEFRLKYERSAGTGQSLLKTIAKCAADGSCYPPTTFDWLAESNTLTSPNSNATGLVRTGWCTEASASIGWMDFNGDGLPDVHCDTPSGTHRVLLSTGKELKSPNSSGDGTIRTNWCAGSAFHAGWIDFNGDGRGDLSCDGEDGSHRVLLSDGIGVKSPNSNADGLIKSSWCAGKGSRASWGNFNADGRADLLCSQDNGTQQALVSTSVSVTSPNSNPDGTIRTNWCAVSGAFTFWSDFNGDRVADIHCSKPDGTQQVLLSDGHTVRSPNSDPEGTVRTNWCAGSGLHRGSTDFNGDGLIDSYCSSDDGRHWVLLSTGKMLVSPNSNADGLLKTGWCAGGAPFWADFNGDGLVDLTCSEPSGRQMALVSDGSALRSPNSNADGLVKSGWCNQTGETPDRADFNGDGYEDFACHAAGSQYVLIHTPGFPDMVSRFTDGIGGVTEVTYSSLTNQAIYSKGAPAAFPLLDVITPMRVAASELTRDGRGASYRFDNFYQGARTDLESRSWLGFEKIRTTEVATGRVKELAFLQAYPSTGFITASNVYDKTKLLASSKFVPAVVQTFPLVYQILNATESTSTYTNGTPDYTNLKTYTYDKYGNAALVADTNPGDTSKAVFICYRYLNSETDWRLGYVDQNKVTRTQSGCETFLSAPKPEWDPQTDLRWNRTEFDAAMNPRSEQQRDDRNNLWLTTHRKFDAAGNPIEVTEPSGAITYFHFDPTFTFPLTEVSPELSNGLHLTTSFGYSLKFGMIESLTDSNGNEQVQILDSFGRMVELKGPDPASGSGSAHVTLKTVQYLRGTGGQYTETKERQTFEDGDPANWNWSRVYVDGLARQFRSERRGADAGQTIVTDTIYDTSGRVWKESYPHFTGVTSANTVTEYDMLNRPTRITTPNGVLDKRDYLRGQLEVRVTTAFGTPEARATVETRDARDNLILTLDPDQRISSAEYDPLSEPVKLVRANGAEITHEIDSLGRTVRTDDADTGVSVQQFDATGRLQREQDADGNITTYQWDALDRMLIRTTKPGDGGADEVFHFGYDDPAVTNGLGNLTSLSGPQYEEKYSYTRYRLIGTEKLTLDGVDYVDKAAFDAIGRTHLREFPDGSKLRTNFYVSGPVQSVDFEERGTNAFKTYGSWTNYNALDQPGALLQGNGLKTDYRYYPVADGLSRLQSWKVAKSDGSQLLSATYEWDLNNEIRRIQRQKNGGPMVEEHFEHDRMGWLTSATGPWGHSKYGYDPNGNVNSKDGVSFTYQPKSNLLLAESSGVSFEHDHTGNVLRKSSTGNDWKYAYNGDGRLTSISKNGQERGRHLYDESGNRLKRVDGQGRISRYISQDFDIFESSGKMVVTRYIRGDMEAIAAVSVSDTQASLRAAVARQAGRAERSLYNQQPGAGLTLFLEAWWRGFANSEDLERIRSYVSPVLMLFALAISFGLLRVASLRTRYSRQHPWFSRIVPLLAAAMIATMSPLPARADLGPGDGYPTPGTLYFHGDQINSNVLVTDEHGSPKTQVAYDPYGSVDQKNSSGPNDFRPKFTSQEWDSDSELYYYGARYYDPSLGRFVQPDPAQDTVSPYVYGDNDPQDFTDSDGEQAEIIVLIVIGAIVGAYTGGAAVNDTANPFLWDWGSGRTLAGILAGAAIGAAGGAIGGVAAEAGPVVGLVGDILVGAGENAAYTALGGGSTKEIAEAAIFGAGMGALSSGIGAGLGRAGSKAAREGEEALAETGGAARSSRLSNRGSDVEADGAMGALEQAPFCSSFPAGTLVATASGMKPIESVQQGTTVLGQMDENVPPASFPAIGVMSRTVGELIQIKTAATQVEATPEHQFWVPMRGWVPASDLKVGDELLTASGTRLAITAAETVKRLTKVHNFEVGTAHTYFVSPERILVHNPPQLKKCKLSALPATKSATTARTKKIWKNKVKALVVEFGDKDVRFYDPPSGRRWLDLESYALQIKQKRAIISLASFGKGSSRPQHFAFANKTYGGIIKDKSFKHTSAYKGQYKKTMRFTWHHHPEEKTIALVPTTVHKKLGHEGSFKNLF